MQNLPSFWKVAKGYMEGKYQKVGEQISLSFEYHRMTHELVVFPSSRRSRAIQLQIQQHVDHQLSVA